MKDTNIQYVAEKLYSYADNKTTHQTSANLEIPSTVYLEKSQWDKEIAEIFKKLPLVLATTAELKENNSYKAMEAVGLPILITRGNDGKVRAFLNVCSHRGAPVAEKGCGLKKRFACKYHGWTFANEGQLIGVAEGHTFGNIDKSEYGLKELPCQEKAGLIFVILTPGISMNLDQFMGAALDDLENVNFESWTYLGKRELDGANWKVAFDGYLEGYHFAQLHPETIHPRTISNLMHYESFGPHMRIGFAQTDIKAKLDAVPREEWGTMENNGYDFVRILFPNLSIFLAPEITQIAQLFPGKTPDTNRTVLNFYRSEPPKDAEDQAGLDGMMDFLLNVVRDEDYLTGSQIQKGLESGAHETVIFGKNERGNQFFHECVDYYVNGCKGPMPQI